MRKKKAKKQVTRVARKRSGRMVVCEKRRGGRREESLKATGE